MVQVQRGGGGLGASVQTTERNGVQQGCQCDGLSYSLNPQLELTDCRSLRSTLAPCRHVGGRKQVDSYARLHRSDYLLQPSHTWLRCQKRE